MLMFGLLVCGFHVLFVARTFFFGGRMRTNSACATVKARVNVIHDNRTIVCVVNYGRVHVHHRSVVREVAAFPASALKADAAVSEPVINPAIKSDVRAPVAAVPSVAATSPAPIPGRPKEPNSGRPHPRARHPEITGVTVRPITRCPKKPLLRANRLFVNRNCRGPHVDRNSQRNLRPPWSRHGQPPECNQREAKITNHTHSASLKSDLSSAYQNEYEASLQIRILFGSNPGGGGKFRVSRELLYFRPLLGR